MIKFREVFCGGILVLLCCTVQSQATQVLQTFADVPNPMHFNLSTLISEYSSNQTLAEIYFHEKFSKEIFKIGKERIFFDVERNYFDESSLDDEFNAIRLFGHLIQSVRINNFHLSANQTLKVNSYIEHCAESLIHLQIDYGDAERMSNLVGPFKALERLEIRFGFLRFEQSNFDEVFPALKYLNIGLMTYTSGCFEQHFPHLVNLVIGNWLSSEKILLSNPQLKHVHLYDGRWDLVAKMSEKLTKLESLSLFQFVDQSIEPKQTIRFESVRSFKFELLSEADSEYFVEDYSNYTAIPLGFGNLEEIECFEPAQQWFNVIMKNRKLRKITTGKLNDEQFIRIADELENLEEFEGDYMTCSGNGMITHFLKRGLHLKKASFPKCEFNGDEVMKQIDGSWKLRKNTFLREVNGKR